MSKNVALALLAVIVLLVGAYFLLGEADTTSESTGSTENIEAAAQSTQSESTAERGVRSFMELVGLGQEMTCSFSTDALDSEYPSNGTVYMGQGKMRLDSTSVVDNTEMQYSMIDDGTYNYSWGSTAEGTFAIKMARVDITEQPPVDESAGEGFDYSQDVEYECEAGSINDSLFTPPADIEFMDMDAMMGGEMSAEAMAEMMEQFGN